MFTHLHVHNYRAIGPNPIDLDLAPLTVLVGDAGSGKSSILEALALTAQSAVEDPGRSDLVTNGTRVSFPAEPGVPYRASFRPLYLGGNVALPLSVGFDWVVPADRTKRFAFADKFAEFLSTVSSRTGVRYHWTRKEILDRTFMDHRLTLDTTDFFTVSTHPETAARPGSVATTTVTVASPEVGVLSTKAGLPSLGERVLDKRLLDYLKGNLLVADLSEEDAMIDGAVLGSCAEFLARLMDELHEALGGVQMLSALRGSQLMHSDVGPPVSSVGSHGECTIRLLASVQAKASGRYRSFKEWAERFGFPGIEAGADGNVLKVLFLDPVAKVPLDLWQASAGSKQCLTLAAQLLLSPPGSTLLLEEPECNLHPAYEKLLPMLFAESVASGHQILLSTHSEILIAALGNTVRKGVRNSDKSLGSSLAPADVAVYHVERGKDGVVAERMNISERGNLAAWVKSFARVEEELFDEWYRELPEAESENRRGHPGAQESRHTGKKKRRRTGNPPDETTL